MTAELQSVQLKNGLVVRFYDQTNRYFGDFHRVCVVVKIEFPGAGKTQGDLTQLPVCYERTLEKMGVTTASLDIERHALVEAFLATSVSYLEKPEFPRQLMLKIKQKKQKPIFMRGSKL